MGLPAGMPDHIGWVPPSDEDTAADAILTVHPPEMVMKVPAC
jgi:hypothetical protein